MTWDLLVTGARLATMVPGAGVVDAGVVAAEGGVVVYAGPEAGLPAGDAAVHLDAGGRLVTPGLVDCHTHLVFGGDRAGEMEQRLAGASYAEIAAAGGGIASTVRATRAATEDTLLASAAARLRHLVRSGVTTVEVKSGYGLDTGTELRLLRVARRLGEECGVTVRTTFLGAHTVPPEYAGRGDEYVDLVVGEMLPAVAAAGLADAVDVFCEPGVGVTPAQAQRVVDAARRHGLPVKLHADQLSDSGAAALAAAAGALSADHLEHTPAAGVAALARAGTVAVLLPGAAHVLGETAVPPVAELRAAGVPMAVATDANPGTSPLLSLPLAMHLACVRFGLTPAEALAGATVHGARALGLEDAGVLAPARRGDLVVWDATRPEELVYWLGATLAATVVVGGRVVGET